MRAFVVVDLAFGDSGKGLLTDFLVRRTGARMVVRYNGGAQAGHNVVAPDGRHHTFSQFGAGTLVPGVETFLSRHMVVHPTALFVEEAHLRSIGVTDALERLRVSERALVVTPFHQAAGRLRELARGAARHGSCGVGVGETVAHALAAPDDAIRAGDLRDLPRLRQTLRRVRERMQAEVAGLDVAGAPARAELAIFEQPDIADQWLESFARIAPLIAGDASWARAPAVVFEGAHGVLLDEVHGFHPYTTWSRCTTAPAMELAAECIPGAEVRRIGVLRTHAVRHGPGPFPTESSDLPDTPPDHNRTNEWQGEVRRGWFDAVLARYAIGVAGEIDALAVTHLDWLTKLTNWTYCDAYDPVVPLDASDAPSLEHQAHLASLLASTRPALRHCAATEEVVLERIENAVGKPVEVGSRGPTANDVFIVGGDSWH